MKITTFFALIVFISVFTFPSCNSDEAALPDPEDQSEEKLAEARVLISGAEADLKNRTAFFGKTIRVPSDYGGLAEAIANAGPNCRIILESGLHEESATVLIDKRVCIQGEPGAILKVETGGPAGPPFPVNPALHIKDVDGVQIQGLQILPAGAAGHTGILVENAAGCRIHDNDIQGFQLGIMLAGADRAKIYDNQVAGLPPEFAGFISWGITAARGQHVIIRGNEVSGYVLGIFVSDRRGRLFKNRLFGNVTGIIVCTVGPVVVLPDGKIEQAPEPANHWLVADNFATDNQWGILVIDGAFENLLVQNETLGNAQYQLELAGPSQRFGFPMPTSKDNRVVSVGRYRDTPIKDCGENNTLIGGIAITDDPCF